MSPTALRDLAAHQETFFLSWGEWGYFVAGMVCAVLLAWVVDSWRWR